MATQNVTHSVIPFASNPQHHLPQVEEITQLEIEMLRALEDRAQQIAEQVETAKESVRTRLEMGATVQHGTFFAYLKKMERRSVAWKAVVERELGKVYARRVLAATRPDKFSTLLIGS